MPPDPPARRPGDPDPGASILERLLDLAFDVSSYLRQHREAAVRASAALLLAGSLAACSPDESGVGDTIEPLTAEVREALPNSPGRYPLQSNTLARDAQGIYYFSWSQPGAAPLWTSARTSLAQLAQGATDELEIPAVGDPILHLKQDTPIPLVDGPTDYSSMLATASLAAPGTTPTLGMTGSSTSSGSSSSRSYVGWYPFFGSYGGSTAPAYRNPPSQDIENNRVQGSTPSQARPSATDRLSGLSYGVSGQSGGTGQGTAASLKSGSDLTASRGGAATAKSGGFSSGGRSGGSTAGSSSG